MDSNAVIAMDRPDSLFLRKLTEKMRFRTRPKGQILKAIVDERF